jgi:hypothetical protein
MMPAAMTQPMFSIGRGLSMRSMASYAAMTADRAIISTMNNPARSSARLKP